jgi:hypothetical protein
MNLHRKPNCPAAAPLVPANNGAAATLPRHLDDAFAAILADDGDAFDRAMAKFEADLAGVGK